MTKYILSLVLALGAILPSAAQTFYSLEKALQKPQKAKRLYCNLKRNNTEKTISKDIGKLTNLIALSLTRGQLSDLPQEIAQLKQLRMLDLSSNAFTTLPKVVTQLTNLEELVLNSNKLNDPMLFQKLSALPKLKHLHLKNCGLSDLPNIEQLKSLTLLNLNRNKITKLPANLLTMQKLEGLALTKNPFTDWAQLMKDLSKINTLVNLSIGRYPLDKLPQEIGLLKNLEYLYLSRAKVMSLPKEIGQLTNLKTLNLSRSQLTSLPKEIAQLTNLEGLNLGRTQITGVPKELEQLKKLKFLSLRRLSVSQEEKDQLRKALPNAKISF